MKNLFIFLLFFAANCNLALANMEPIVVQNGGAAHDHSGNPIVPADQPDVYYDSATQSIIIDGTGCVSYYDVEITSLSSWTVHVSTQVSGYYDTIDISSLPQDDYVITIDSPLGNSYEGFFDTY